MEAHPGHWRTALSQCLERFPVPMVPSQELTDIVQMAAPSPAGTILGAIHSRELAWGQVGLC